MEKIVEKQKLADIKKKSSGVNTVETHGKKIIDTSVVDRPLPVPILEKKPTDNEPPKKKKSYVSILKSAIKWGFIAFSFFTVITTIFGTFYESKWLPKLEESHHGFDIACALICFLLYGLDTTGYLERWFKIDSVRQVTFMTIAVPITTYIMELYTKKYFHTFLVGIYSTIFLLVSFAIFGIWTMIRNGKAKNKLAEEKKNIPPVKNKGSKPTKNGKGKGRGRGRGRGKK